MTVTIYEAPIGKSNHDYWEMAVETVEDVTDNQDFKLIYWNGDYGNINRELAKIDWSTESNYESIEDAWTAFKEKLKKLVQVHIPFKATFRAKKTSPSVCQIILPNI